MKALVLVAAAVAASAAAAWAAPALAPVVAAITVLVEVAGASHLAGLRPRAWAPAAALAALLAAGLVWLFAAALGPAYPEVALLRGPWRAPVATFVFGLFALTDARRVHTRVEGAER